MSDCRTCQPPETCLETLDRYSLQEDTYFWNFICPYGDCSSLSEISVICCDGTELSLTIPESTSPEIRQLLLKSLLNEAGRRLSFCDPPVTPGTPTTPVQLYWNGPQSCTVLCPNGSGFTYTVRAGRYLALSQVVADTLAHNEACRLARLHKFCLSDLPDKRCAGSVFSERIIAVGPGVTTTMRWSVISGALPTGLTLTQGFLGPRATLSGTPTTPGTYSFTVQATAQDGDYMSRSYTICIVGMTPDTLPDATQGTAYSQTLTAPACATAPLSWQVTSGALPAGLTLDEETGKIAGTPTVTGDFTFTITLQTEAS